MVSYSTLIPNIILDQYLKELKLAELKVLLIIIRQTLGWEDKRTKSERKELDWIASNQLAQKTACSKRSINDAIQSLIQKNLIEVFSSTGEFLDAPEKRRGQQKLFFRPSSAITAFVENKGNKGLQQDFTDSANANFAGDLRKNITSLAQKMRITKETLQKKLLQN
jgi:phage replication O-like protein O